MNKLVVLSLGNGDLDNGFPVVTALLWEPNNPHPMKFTGSLPAAPEIPELYSYWRVLYLALYQRLDLDPRLEIDSSSVTNVSEIEFSELCHKLQISINDWLNSEPFRNIDQQLRTQLDESEEIRFIIETNDNLLRRLPWHLWSFFEDYPKAEVALSASEYKRPKKSTTKSSRSEVRILAILGNSQGIDIGKDRAFLEQLSVQAKTKFLVEPQLEELNDQLWQSWDILFFAGHSSSQEQGLIQLNQTDSLTLDKLKYGLKKAIHRGLKLAIFNSCDGLGLAQALADLHIPQVIVMREPVPDVVAQEFLRHFLSAFVGGQTLYASVREARERLERLDGKYPCATWLPVICQNPAEVPPTWQEWCDPNKGDSTVNATVQNSLMALKKRILVPQASIDIAAPEAETDILGTLLNNRYQIQKVLGQGGFGRTYLASDDQRFGELCVLKEFIPNSKVEYTVQKLRALFEVEAKVLHQINHPQIPKFLAWFAQKGRLFIVQEYIDGKTYAHLLRERIKQGQLFSEAEIVLWLKNLLPVLTYLHERNMVHRDISPDNVMLPNGQSRPMLIDFGLVKQKVTQTWAFRPDTRTSNQSFVGKFGYVPLEQIRMGQCYPCSDLYALGVTAVVLLTGVEPNFLIDRGSLEWRWHSYVAISNNLGRILDKMLAEKPKDRYQSAQEVLAELQQHTLPEEIAPRPPIELHTDFEQAGTNEQVIKFEQSPKQTEKLRSDATETEPITSKFINRCQQELARHLGPMAKYILEETLEQHPDISPGQLIEVLAAEIPHPQQAQFKNSLAKFDWFETETLQPSIVNTTSEGSTPESFAASPKMQTEAAMPSQLNPGFINHCRQELARHLGPMAKYILEETIEQHPDISPAQLVEAISTEVLNTQQANDFRQSLIL